MDVFEPLQFFERGGLQQTGCLIAAHLSHQYVHVPTSGLGELPSCRLVTPQVTQILVTPQVTQIGPPRL